MRDSCLQYEQGSQGKDVKKMALLANYFLVLAFWLSFAQGIATSLSAHSIEGYLASITSDEKKELSAFFEEIILKDSFGYTIFGDKPISFAAYNTATYIDNFDDCSFLVLERGGEIWKKYADLFPNSNFIFKFESFVKDGRQEIYLINKKAVYSVVSDHIEIFKKNLGDDDFSPEKLLLALENKDTTIQGILHDNEGLFGILLGFGYKNSFAFQRKYEVISAIQYMLLHPLSLPLGNEAMLQEHFLLLTMRMPASSSVKYENITISTCESLFNEFLTLKKELKSFHDKQSSLELFSLPSFMALSNDSETQVLLENYTKTRREMTRAYSHGNFLEVTLCAMIAS